MKKQMKRKRKVWIIIHHYKKNWVASLCSSSRKAIIVSKRMQELYKQWNYSVKLVSVSPYQVLIKSPDSKRILGWIYIQHVEIK